MHLWSGAAKCLLASKQFNSIVNGSELTGGLEPFTWLLRQLLACVCIVSNTERKSSLA